MILGDPDQYCKETLYFYDFSRGGGGGPDPLSPLWIRPWHASERTYLSEMFRDHRRQSRTRLKILVCLFASEDLRLQTLIAGRKSRERERERKRARESVRETDCMVFAHKSFVMAWFLRISKHNVWVSQSIFR